jgi:hyperosmotically inducible protein
MRTNMLQLGVLSALLFCGGATSAETVADRSQKAADKAADKAEKATEKAQNAADKAADKAQKVADKAADNAEKAADKADRTAQNAGDKLDRGAKKASAETSDSWLTAKTKIALWGDTRVSGNQVNVQTKQAVVTLRGKVDSETAKLAATEITQGIDGVKEVKNELAIVPAAQRKMVEAKDDYIVSTVKERLGKDRRTKDAKIDVRSDAGVVTLSGEVATINASVCASEVASGVPGVRSVKNTIATKPGL